DGGHADVSHAHRGDRLWPRDGRTDHPRNRLYAHGERPVDVGAEQQLPGARRQEPVRGRRRPVRVQRGQELHVVDSRAVHADQRVHRGRAAKGEPVTTIKRGAGGDRRKGTSTRSALGPEAAPSAKMKRRTVLQMMAAAPMAAAMTWTEAEAAQAHE